MTQRLIKPYLQWVNEATTPGQPQPTNTPDAVLFISASSSASNITPNLAEKLGVKVNTKYKVEVTNSQVSGGLGRFFQLSTKDGSKFGTTAKITEIGPVTAGQDYLKINGKEITETGQIVLTRSDVEGGVTIEAANNGLLVLARFGDALADLGTTYKIYLGLCANFAIKFSLGGKVGAEESTGFSYYWAKPGQLQPTENLIAIMLAEAALKVAGFDNAIAKADNVAGGWSKAIDSWGIQNFATEFPKNISGHLKKRKTLADPNPPALQSWTAVTANPKALFNIPNSQGSKLTFTPNGLKLLQAAAQELAKSVSTKAVPAGFGAESDAVLKSYANIVTTEISTPNLTSWLEQAQVVNNWGSTTTVPGGAGTGKANQGEGGFGRPQPAPTKS